MCAASNIGVTLKLFAELIEIAKPHAAAMHRTAPQQIEHWAWLGKAVEENPELSVPFTQDTPLAVEKVKEGSLTEYPFSSK